MKTLAFDTSTKILTIACFGEGEVKASFHKDVGITHSELLVPTIDEMLKGLEWGVKNIDLICMGLGPGSFTGLRIAAAMVKGITAVTHSKVVGVSTMDAIVRNAPYGEGRFAPFLDAHKGKVYTCVYRKDKNGIKRLTDYLLVKADEFLAGIETEVFFFGNGIEKYKSELDSCDLALYNEDIDWYPNAVEIGHIGIKIASERTDDPKTLEPLYLHSKEANITKHKR